MSTDRRPDYTFTLMLLWIGLIVLGVTIDKAAHRVADAIHAAAKCPTAEAAPKGGGS